MIFIVKKIAIEEEKEPLQPLPVQKGPKNNGKVKLTNEKNRDPFEDFKKSVNQAIKEKSKKASFMNAKTVDP